MQILFIILGVFLSFIGYNLYFKNKIHLLQDYLHRYVLESDLIAFSKAMGMLFFIMSLSLISSAQITIFTKNNTTGSLVLIPGFVISIALFVFIQKRYNNKKNKVNKFTHSTKWKKQSKQKKKKTRTR